MTISINTNWLAAAQRKNPEVVYLLTLTDGVTSWKATNGRSSVLTYPAALVSVSGLASEINPTTREIGIDEIDVTVRYEWIRDIIVNNRLRGQKCLIEIGFADLAEADFIEHYAGPVRGVFPDIPNGTVRIECFNALEILQKLITGYWVNVHPLDAMLDILQTKVGLPAALIDSGSFDPDDADYTAISHFVVSAVTSSELGIGRTYSTPTPAFDILNELAKLMNGTLYVTNVGVVSFRIFDSSAAAAATWTEDHISSLEQIALDDFMVNRVQFESAPVTANNNAWVDRSTTFDSIYQLDDVTSQTDHAYPGATELIASHKVGSDWLIGEASLGGAVDSNSMTASDTSLVLFGPRTPMFCGTRESASGLTQPANAKISASRPLYLELSTGERISATSLTPTTSQPASKLSAIDENGSRVSLPASGSYYKIWTLGGIARSALGSTAVLALRDTIVRDITIQHYVCSQILKRHHYGLSVVEVETSLAEYDKEPGDLVSLTHNDYLAYSLDGIEAADGKFEIIKKEIADSDNPSIRWTLAWAGEDSPTLTSSGAILKAADPMRQLVDTALSDEALARIASGFDVTDQGGLVGRIMAGKADAGMIVGELASSDDVTFVASTDSYVYFDIASQSPIIIALANDASPPIVDPGWVLLAKVVTDGTEITSIDTTTGVKTSTSASATSFLAGVSTWTERANPKNFLLNNVLWVDDLDLFVAVGGADGTDAYIVTSPDGITWTERANPKNFELVGIAYSASLSLLVAVGAADGTDAYIVTSTDAITWTERANPKNFILYAVHWDSIRALFVAVGAADGSDAYLVTSTDGTTWTERANTDNIRLSAVTSRFDIFVAVGAKDSSDLDAYIATSAGSDVAGGTTWSSQRANPQNYNLSDVKNVDGRFVAVGNNNTATGSYALTSDDGITWTETIHPVAVELVRLAVIGGKFVVVVGNVQGGSGYLAVSTDGGVRWSRRVTPKNFALYGIAFGNSIFVAVGAADGTDAYMLTSAPV